MSSISPANHHQHALDYWQIIRNRFGLILLCFLLVFGSAAIITHIMPRKYRGLVELELKRQLQDAQIVGQFNQDATSMSDNFLKTQLEIITKRKTLDRVVDKLNLMERWKIPGGRRQFAIGRLQGNLDPQSIARSEMISITYYDEDAQLAADIANAVAESYRETRLEVDRELADNSIRQFALEVAAKEQVAEQAKAKMRAIKEDLGIIEMVSDSRTTGRDVIETLDKATLSKQELDIYERKNELEFKKSKLTQIQTLDGDSLIRRAGELKLDNETIRKQWPNYQDLLLKRESLSAAGLGRKHPNMVGFEREIQTAREQLLDAASDYRDSLKLQISLAEQDLANAEKSYQVKRTDALKKESENEQYLLAKEQWEMLSNELLKLRATLSQQQLYNTIPKTPFTIHKAALEPEPAPAKPNVKLNLALGAVVGLMFGFGVAFFLEYLDTTVKSIDEVERVLGLPVLAVIPKNVAPLHRSTGLNPDAEAYRILRTNIEFNRKDPDANVISVVSGGSGEGKSTTMVNLATVCAQGGYNTLIIDGDLRRPRMHALFDTTNEVGLSTYLSSKKKLEEVVVQTAIDNLYLIPSGMMPVDSSGMLNSPRFRELLLDVKSRFDIVLIDSPPILGVSDASVLAAEADLTLLVIQHRKLPRHMLQRVKDSVEAVGGNLIGVVLNNVDINSDATYGYYTSYYTYYSDDARKKAGKSASARQPAATSIPDNKRPRPASYQDAF